MKTVNRNIFVKGTWLATICLALFSFSSSTPGGDHFEVFLNGKQVLQHYVHQKSGVPTLNLNASSENDRLEIYYSHCGQVGTGRVITIRDSDNKLLKQWKFANVQGKNTRMACKLNEIVKLKKNDSQKLRLYYSSTELPEGRLLASISTSDNRSASMKK